MLSKKLTFSLTSLVAMIAFGLAFVLPVADAAEWWQYEPEVTLSVTDVSNAPGNQVEAYAARTGDAAGNPLQIPLGAASSFDFFIKVTKGQASVNVGINGSTVVSSGAVTGGVADQLDLSDLRFTLLDEDGVVISSPNSAGATVADYIGLFGTAAENVLAPVHSVDDGKNFRVTITGSAFSDTTAGNAAAMLVHLPAGSFRNTEPAAVSASLVDAEARATGKNKKAPDHNLPIMLVPAEPAAGNPDVVSTVRIVSTATTAASRFQEAQVSGPFQIRITLTEEGHNFASADGKKSDYISVINGTLTRIVPGVPFLAATAPLQTPPIAEGNYPAATDIPGASGRDQMYHPYLVTIEPDLRIRSNAHENRVRNVEIRVKAFNDLAIPANGWVPPTNYALAVNRSLLSVPINPAAITDIFAPAGKDKPSNEKFLPDGLVIPAGGYLVIAQGNAAQTGITSSPAKIADKKLPAQKLYNVSYGFGFPAPGNDLEALFRVGGTIRLSHADIAENTPATGAKANDNGYLVSNTAHAAGSVVISEIMWGRDASLGTGDATKSQWIELYNPGAVDISIDQNEWTLAFYQGSGPAGANMIDEVSNASPYWPAPGSSGATLAQRRVDVVDPDQPNDPIVASVFENFDLGTVQSMYRKIAGTTVMSGTSLDSWMGSTAAGTRNLSGLRAGTPGAETPYTPPAAPPEPAPVVTPVAMKDDIMITEIMVDTGSGRLPQWLELTNVSGAEVSLAGWSVEIENAAGDADVIAAKVEINLSGTLGIGGGEGAGGTMGKSLLLVGGTARSSSNLADSDRVVDISSQVVQRGRYTFLSSIGFKITLVPPQTTGILQYGDMAGNLGAAAAWDIPMDDAGRSSLIRREMLADGMATMGTDANGWVLASDTPLVSGPPTWYGSDEDAGTPGYDAGGPLPVELSHFRPARDKATGAVVITWSTQSELNNAGFFIKRSNQSDGEFKVINATMIAGAGTTSEKQSYTYTDTTAQPNIVYYYQIEDVSLDGQRQTLTRAYRLKGHIGAAGKATTTWGELKSSREQ
ncbi:MAG: hypothetical protein OXG97_07680 [Candidatus Poribacteria bacterium]|nr:hypothetical protein [Candidatus Poribacteria bacterium]